MRHLSAHPPVNAPDHARLVHHVVTYPWTHTFLFLKYTCARLMCLSWLGVPQTLLCTEETRFCPLAALGRAPNRLKLELERRKPYLL